MSCALEVSHVELQPLWDLWLSKKGERLMPSRADIDVLELKPWIANLALLEPIDAGRDFRFRVHGSRLVARLGQDLTGKTLSSLPASERARREAFYRRVCSEKRPFLVRFEEMIESGLAFMTALFLPLSADGETVDCVLVGAYREASS